MGLGLDEAEGDLSKLRKEHEPGSHSKTPSEAQYLCCEATQHAHIPRVACWAFSLPRAVILNLI